MKAKKMVAILCCITLAVTLFSGCSKPTSGNSNPASRNPSGNSNPTSGNSTYTVRVWGYGDANSKDMKELSEKISKITKEKIGANVDLYRSSDKEKLNLALTSGEKMDLVCAHGMDRATMASTGRIIPLDDLMEKYCKDIKDQLPPKEMKCGELSGHLYFLPQNNDNARSAGFAMRKDIVDALHIDVSKIKTMNDMHDILVKVKKAYPKLYPIVPTWGGGGMQNAFHYDNLGLIGCLEDCRTDSTKVVNWYKTDEYKNFVHTMYLWQQEGLIMPDATTTTEDNLIGSVGFADFENIKPGKAEEIYKSAGVKVVLVPLIPAFKSTATVRGEFCISAASEKPEKAMELWHLMYTDSEISNLFINGLEGKHYVYVDDSKKVIRLPKGVKAGAGKSGYDSLDWAWPNCMITPVWEGTDPDLWKKLDKFNKTATVSPALGFFFDDANVLNEVTACQTVLKKYEVPLNWGTINPDEALPKFYKDLEDAGSDTIVAEMQKQFDAWLSKNK